MSLVEQPVIICRGHNVVTMRKLESREDEFGEDRERIYFIYIPSSKLQSTTVVRYTESKNTTSRIFFTMHIIYNNKT